MSEARLCHVNSTTTHHSYSRLLEKMVGLPPGTKVREEKEKKFLENDPKESYDLQDIVKAGALLVNDDVALSVFVGS